MKPSITQFELEKLVRPNILELTPYRCARDDYEEGVLLDANENALGSNIDDPDSLHRYPDPHQQKLRKALATFREVSTENVFVGNGSDEAIDLLIRIFCRPGVDRIIITPPTYGMYKVAASIQDCGIISVPLTPDFDLKPDQILEQASEKSKLLFLCSPNNPTANELSFNKIENLIHFFAGIVVLDEAYIDFSSRKSLAGRIAEFPNLVILQTLSKSFGLAGLRLGIAIASAGIIRLMMSVKAPYNINKLTLRAAEEAVGNTDLMQKHVDELLVERARLRSALANIPSVEKIFPSDANFLLLRVPDALSVYRRLAEQGIIVRYRGDQIHCENCLRITVGTRTENDLLINQLTSLLP
ncbi:MAG TPA: histidinol-phosphate transaminase [Balneolales bacterium]|nr:histidinol-phosphate transaminase [Balneolales bacterium]